MPKSTSWALYGHHAKLQLLKDILSRHRWFFLQISSSRRIGKTTLIQQALHGPQSLADLIEGL